MKLSELSIPNNAIVKPIFEEFPHDAVSLICHGGYGIIHAGLVRKIPTFVFPFHVEHLCNAHRLSALGGGVCFGKIANENFSGLTHNIKYNWENFTEIQAARRKQEASSFEVKLCNDDDLYTTILKLIT